MLIIRLCFFCIILINYTYCQESTTVVVDSDNNLLPFATIKCADTVLFPDETGRVNLTSYENCSCKHLGFRDFLIKKPYKDTIRLTRKTISLSELTVNTSTLQEELEILGPIGKKGKNKKIRRTWGTRVNRGSILTYIPFESHADKINSIIIKLNDISDSVNFMFRLIEVDSNKLPKSNILYSSPIFDKYKYNPIFKIDHLNLSFPRNGVYVCLDWVCTRHDADLSLGLDKPLLMFNLGMRYNKPLCRYKTFITTDVNLSSGQLINSCENGYIKGAPTIGIEVSTKSTSQQE